MMRRLKNEYIQSPDLTMEAHGPSFNMGTFFIPITVIFFGLLLFFMFKASISEKNLTQTQSYTKRLLEGKLSAQQKKQIKSDRKEITDSFLSLNSLRNTIEQKFSEINNIITKVELKRETINSILKKNTEQEIIVANFKDIMREKNMLLAMKEVAISMLQKKLSTEGQKYKGVIAKLNHNIHQLENLQKQRLAQSSTINNLKNDNQLFNKINKQYLKMIGHLKEKELKQNYVNKLLSVSNKKYRKDNETLNLDTSVLSKRLSKMLAEKKELMVKNERYQLVRDRLLGFNKQLKKKIKSENLVNKSGRFPASQLSQKVKDAGYKDEIINELLNVFKNKTYSVEVNPKNGNLILKSSRGYLFEKNSYNLTLETKNILKKVIPMYAEVLFSNKKIAKSIASINVVGHSSPTFNRRFVNPEEDNPKAYAFNIRLSSLRATKLTEYIFSDQIENFPYKMAMQKVVHSTGRGYSDSLKKSHEEDKKQCELYDCLGSRRVELSFSLKE